MRGRVLARTLRWITSLRSVVEYLPTMYDALDIREAVYAGKGEFEKRKWLQQSGQEVKSLIVSEVWN